MPKLEHETGTQLVFEFKGLPWLAAGFAEGGVPRIGGVADARISAGALSVTGITRGGEAVVSGFEDDYYMVTADVAITGSNTADLFVYYIHTRALRDLGLTVPPGICRRSLPYQPVEEVWNEPIARVPTGY